MLIQLEVTEQVAKFIIKNLEINLVTSSFPALGNQNRTDIEVTKIVAKFKFQIGNYNSIFSLQI